MAAPNEKLAASLAELRKLQAGGRSVFKSGEISRVHRERLVQNGFLGEIIKGWLISSSPSTQPGDSTPWYASFWDFCETYCDARFGQDWHLSAEQSLLLNAERRDVPRQAVVYSPKAGNNNNALPFGTSLYDMRESATPPTAEIVVRDGLRMFTPAAALCRVPAHFFTANPVEAQVALSGVRGLSDILTKLLDDGQSVVAGRLAGAFRRVGRSELADEILRVMTPLGYDVRVTDPFSRTADIIAANARSAPISLRLRSMWSANRGKVIDAFPAAPGLPEGLERQRFLAFVDDIYPNDAYHSLSIEGYHVTPELIERVRSEGWDPEARERDRKDLDALGARGYWEAFQLVKAAVTAIVDGADAAALVRSKHRDWYRELFQPCVVVGALKASDLAGYRQNAVYLRSSRFLPPREEVVYDAMETLFDLMEEESEPSVRAVLGHWLVGFIHPFQDGNGRTARFVMNTMLASGGYPWTIVRVDDRTEYLAALDTASLDGDIGPFAKLIADRVRWSMVQYAEKPEVAPPDDGPTATPSIGDGPPRRRP